ncbi:unnamed protein product, partial [Closterium sp. NIES-53]
MTSFRVLLHVAVQRDYELHSLDFSIAFLQGSLHEEVWLRRSSSFTGTFPPGTQVALADVKRELQKRHTCTGLGELRHYLGLQITRDKAACTITLLQAHMVQQILQRFELQHCTVQRTPLAVDHRLTGPFPDKPFEPSGPMQSLWAASSMAAKEMRWLTFLLTDLGERPSSAPTLFTDNKASIILCQEPQMESSVKHINVRYNLLRELQRRGQAHFDFVESEANTADIFTKAHPPCDHQLCCVQLGLLCCFVTGL